MKYTYYHTLYSVSHHKFKYYLFPHWWNRQSPRIWIANLGRIESPSFSYKSMCMKLDSLVHFITSNSSCIPIVTRIYNCHKWRFWWWISCQWTTRKLLKTVLMKMMRMQINKNLENKKQKLTTMKMTFWYWSNQE